MKPNWQLKAWHWVKEGMPLMVEGEYLDAGQPEVDLPIYREILSQALENFSKRRLRKGDFWSAGEAKRRAQLVRSGKTCNCIIHRLAELPL
jgi:hypothetical protein